MYMTELKTIDFENRKKRIIEYMQREAEAAMFDMEYTRWQEEQQRLLTELRMATQEHLAENELRMFVDNCLAHYDHLINLKAMVAKTDVFHLISGAWKSPAERCFLWMGGFRPSEIIKVNLVFACTKSIIFYICPYVFLYILLFPSTCVVQPHTT